MPLETLRSCTLFAGLDDEALTQVSTLLEERIFKQGESLFAEGDRGDAFYIVRAGTVRLFKTLHSGESMDVAVLGPGSVFGEMALISDQPRSATCFFVSDSTLLRCSRESLGSLAELCAPAYMTLLQNFAKILCVRLATANVKGLLLLRELKECRVEGEKSTRSCISRERLMDFLKSLDTQTEEGARKTFSDDSLPEHE